MQIVRLNEGNKHVLSNIADGVFDNEISPISLAAFLSCPRHIMLLAVEDGLVVGMLSAVEYFHPDKPPQLWINELGVTPDRRNQGVGRQLSRDVIALARRRGCVSVWVGTEKTNLPANRCFASIEAGDHPTEFVMYQWHSRG